ncbi:MAG: bifunctional glutamate N-acetyltransferase/amino-acid acetyltransferase ArgJ [Chloroflexota bacterium]|nr:bifunctional glutamate N-acetyltransferase/amino-acid acetyltransferase ArgJ [Chloroflexota bacterium]
MPSGTISSVPGFLAGAVHAGIRSGNEPDLALLYSRLPCTAAGVFTTNQIKSAPVLLSQEHLSNGRAQAIAVNSGCANACAGGEGPRDALEMAGLAAAKLGTTVSDVLVASTGIIGMPLPMAHIREGIKEIELSSEGGHSFVRAIMTTDTRPKEIAYQFDMKGARITIAGVAKGSGMIHPDLATVLAFIATDALIDGNFMQSSLHKAAELSFNMVSVDGETSPSDSVFLLANGLAGNEIINQDNGEAFQHALNEVCTNLARSIAQDGEGATKLIEVTIEGAKRQADARQAARTIVSAPLVKAAVYGNDPNWGRIVAALGRSGVQITERKLDVYLNNTQVVKQGYPVLFDREEMQKSLKGNSVSIRLHLNSGDARATAWGCDLSEQYVTINSAYST